MVRKSGPSSQTTLPNGGGFYFLWCIFEYKKERRRRNEVQRLNRKLQDIRKGKVSTRYHSSIAPSVYNNSVRCATKCVPAIAHPCATTRCRVTTCSFERSPYARLRWGK